MQTGVREMPAYLETLGSIKTDWHIFSCAFLPRFEEMISEARRRYVGT